MNADDYDAIGMDLADLRDSCRAINARLVRVEKQLRHLSEIVEHLYQAAEADESDNNNYEG